MSALDVLEEYARARLREVGGHELALSEAVGSGAFDAEARHVAQLVRGATEDLACSVKERLFAGVVSAVEHDSVDAFVRQHGVSKALQRVLRAAADSPSPSP